MKKNGKKIARMAKKIRLLLTDCDGVLTDGRVYYSARGEEMKAFSLRDGMGVERLRALAHVETGVITGENSEMVKKRMEKLAIREYHPGIADKYEVMKEIMAERELSSEQIAYIGDDCNDLEIMKHAGLTACPSDAQPLVRAIAHLVTENKGGHGAFREFAEFIIQKKDELK